MARGKLSKKRTLKSIPKFASEDAERAFWATHDTTDYLDWSRARSVVFPNLRPSEDDDDQAAFRDRAKEPRITFEAVVRDLKKRGKL